MKPNIKRKAVSLSLAALMCLSSISPAVYAEGVYDTTSIAAEDTVKAEEPDVQETTAADDQDAVEDTAVQEAEGSVEQDTDAAEETDSQDAHAAEGSEAQDTEAAEQQETEESANILSWSGSGITVEAVPANEKAVKMDLLIENKDAADYGTLFDNAVEGLKAVIAYDFNIRFLDENDEELDPGSTEYTVVFADGKDLTAEFTGRNAVAGIFNKEGKAVSGIVSPEGSVKFTFASDEGRFIAVTFAEIEEAEDAAEETAEEAEDAAEETAEEAEDASEEEAAEAEDASDEKAEEAEDASEEEAVETEEASEETAEKADAVAEEADEEVFAFSGAQVGTSAGSIGVDADNASLSGDVVFSLSAQNDGNTDAYSTIVNETVTFPEGVIVPGDVYTDGVSVYGDGKALFVLADGSFADITEAGAAGNSIYMVIETDEASSLDDAAVVMYGDAFSVETDSETLYGNTD